MARNYRKEYDNYHSRPEQKLRRAARNAARASLKKTTAPEKLEGKDVHHKDNDPMNNDKSNLSIVSQRYNRREPRLRVDEMSNAEIKKALKKVKGLTKQQMQTLATMPPTQLQIVINTLSGLVMGEDMGSVTGPHIAGTGDDNTVHTKPKKKKVNKRISLIKSMAGKR